MAFTEADEVISPQRLPSPTGRNFEEAITKSAAKAVKGVGHVTKGIPLDDASDGQAIFTKSHDLMLRTKAATTQGRYDAETVLSGLSPDFAGHPQFSGRYAALKASAEIQKNFTAQNLGATGARLPAARTFRAALCAAGRRCEAGPSSASGEQFNHRGRGAVAQDHLGRLGQVPPP